MGVAIEPMLTISGGTKRVGEGLYSRAGRRMGNQPAQMKTNAVHTIRTGYMTLYFASVSRSSWKKLFSLASLLVAPQAMPKENRWLNSASSRCQDSPAQPQHKYVLP